MKGVLLAALFLCAMAVSVGQAAEASGNAMDREVADALRAIEQRRASLTAEDREASRRLNAAGDRAYRQQQYGLARRSYMSSYPNYPNAHAYIMSGDAHWRSVVQHRAGMTVPPHGGAPACKLSNEHFAEDLSLDVARHYEVGLLLADRERHLRRAQRTLYRRARESAVCLKVLAEHYRTQPAESCVDVSKLQDCLGEPLLR